MIVEDGTGVEDANALIDLAFADAYHAARGRAEWASAAQEQREASIVRATDFICRHYDARWRGSKTVKAQTLCWPRRGIEDADGDLLDDASVPLAVRQATAELALQALQGDISAGSTQRVIKSVSVGPVSVDYADEAITTSMSETTIDALLSPFIAATGGRSVRLNRVW